MTERTVEQIRADRDALDKELEEKLAKDRQRDLELVKEKIKLHKFTKTQLRSVLPNRRKPKNSDDKPKKP